MRDRRFVAEIGCLLLLLAYLIWVPLPFGSAADRAQAPLIIPPLLIAAAAVLLHGGGGHPLAASRPARLWTVGGILTLAVVALQMIPLPMPLLAAVSPESARIWEGASRVARLAGVSAATLHPITIDPDDTLLQFFRLAAYLATFTAALLLVRSARRRTGLAVLLAVMAIFETVYAVREASLQRYAIWGWKNSLMFNRASGTFVNPNHFAHYAAIIFPLALFLSAYAWHSAAPSGTLLRYRILHLIERRIVLFVFGLAAALASVAAVLIAQSRGAALALIGGVSITGAIASGRRHAARRAVLVIVALLATFAGMMLLLGRTDAASRFGERNPGGFEGRRSAVTAAFDLWTRFPLFGSGAGTFEDLAPSVQEGGQLIANHAHDDYIEAAATTGAIGLCVGLIPLLAGTAALARTAFGARAEQMSWRRRAFHAAALTSIVIALLHALVDFNFYIPANPVTLAAIAGAAVSVKETEA